MVAEMGILHFLYQLMSTQIPSPSPTLVNYEASCNNDKWPYKVINVSPGDVGV